MMAKKRTINKLANGISKKKTTKKEITESENTVGVEIIKALSEEERNALYVLDRDEDGHVFGDLEKRFIANWIEFKNLVVVSSMLGITQKEAAQLLGDGHIRKEIDRISQARVKFRFARRIMTLDECEAYLTTSITDEGVALADQLNSKDKLSAVKLLLEVKQMKADSLVNPTVIDNTPVELQLEQLSEETIKAMIETATKKKEDVASNINVRQTIKNQLPDISEAEKKDIDSMPPEELLKLLDTINKK